MQISPINNYYNRTNQNNENYQPSFQGFPAQKMLTFLDGLYTEGKDIVVNVATKELRQPTENDRTFLVNLKEGIATLKSNLGKLMEKCHEDTTVDLAIDKDTRVYQFVFKNGYLPNGVNVSQNDFEIPSKTRSMLRIFVKDLNDIVEKMIERDQGDSNVSVIDELLYKTARGQIVKEVKTVKGFWQEYVNGYRAKRADKFAKDLGIPATVVKDRAEALVARKQAEAKQAALDSANRKIVDSI